MNRKGEFSTILQQSDRCFTDEGYWYYKTREHVDIGPFDSEVEAQRGVADFIDFICAAEPKVIETFEQCARSAA